MEGTQMDSSSPLFARLENAPACTLRDCRSILELWNCQRMRKITNGRFCRLFEHI